MNFSPDFCKLTRFWGNMQMYLCKKNHNPFWKDVLQHYKNLYTRCEPKNQDEFMSECLFYNIKIIRDKRVVYVNEWFNEGIFSIHHLTNAEGNYLKYNEFKQKIS